jgi:2-methylcitrate dehydratase PrpD
LTAGDIESVELFVSPFMNQLIGAPFDTNGDLQVTAQFSAQYSVASAIIRRRLGIAEIQEDAVMDPKVGELARRVKVTVDESNKEKFAPTEMLLRTKNGAEIRRRMEHVPGTPEFPMSESEHEQKFRECTSQGPSPLPAAKRHNLIERTRKVLTISDMADFFSGIL